MQVEATRKKMEYAFNNVCGIENTKRLDQMTQLRAQVTERVPKFK